MQGDQAKYKDVQEEEHEDRRKARKAAKRNLRSRLRHKQQEDKVK